MRVAEAAKRQRCIDTEGHARVYRMTREGFSRGHRNFRPDGKLRAHLGINLVYTGHRERRHHGIGDRLRNLVRLPLHE
jgi:hypothetical protein